MNETDNTVALIISPKLKKKRIQFLYIIYSVKIALQSLRAINLSNHIN